MTARGRTAPGAICLLLLLSAGCHRSPPASRFPTAADALARMRESQACSRGVSGEAKLYYVGESGRVRGSMLFVAAAPDRVRFDVFSPFGATLSTLTSNGSRFALYELAKKTFLSGPANACNLQRFTRVPLPPHAFVQLLRGEAPVLAHEPASAQLEWDSGSYRVTISGRHRAEQEIRLVPPDADWSLDWSKQRLRVVEVTVRQAEAPLYRVELEDHAPVQTGAPRLDPDGIDPPILPSGPECRAELPRRLHFVVGDDAHDVVLANHDLFHNPPLLPGVFEQQPPPGVSVRSSPCGD